MVTKLNHAEKSALIAFDQTLKVIRDTTDADELAILLLMASLLYAEIEVKCDEKAAANGYGTVEVAACEWDMNRGRDKLLKTFQYVAGRIK